MMKKSLLTVALVSTAALFSMAADDCSGSNIVKCTTDDDCDATAGEACAIADGETEGQCVVAQCAENTDCDLQDTSAGSPIADTADFANGCEAEEYVTIIGFDGNEYCAVEPTADIACEDIATGSVTATATLKAGGTADVCVLADGTCNLETLSCE